MEDQIDKLKEELEQALNSLKMMEMSKTHLEEDKDHLELTRVK